MNYPIVIHKDKSTLYGVIVPDLSGCFSSGETIEEAKSNAVEAIECHIEGLLKDNEPVPTPQHISVHKGNPDFSDGVWAYVEVEFSKVQL